MARADGIISPEANRTKPIDPAGPSGSGSPDNSATERPRLGTAAKPLSWWARARRDKVLLLMALPGLALLLAFHYLPLFGNLIALPLDGQARRGGHDLGAGRHQFGEQLARRFELVLAQARTCQIELGERQIRLRRRVLPEPRARADGWRLLHERGAGR